MIEQINAIAQGWWDWMWPMFWQVSVLIILIGAVDFILRRHVWPQVRYALWLLVLVKLVLPPSFSLSTSVISQARTKTEQIAVKLVAANRPAKPASNELRSEMNAYITDVGTVSLSTPEAKISGVENGSSVRADMGIIGASGANVKIHWHVYVMAVWFVVMVTLFSWATVRFRKLRKFHTSEFSGADLPQWFGPLLAEKVKKLGFRKLPEVVLSRDVSSPAVFGPFKPVLVLPAATIDHLSHKQTGHILLHELAHIKRGDLLVNTFYMFLQIVYWFNPLLWLLRRKLQHLRELCCDATVARILKDKTADYREAILEVAQQFLAKPVEAGIGLLGMVETSSRLLVRIKWLEKKTWKYSGVRFAIIFIIVGFMSACVLPMAKAKSTVVSGRSEAGTVDPSDIALLYHKDPDVRIKTIKTLAVSNDSGLIDDLIRAHSVEDYTPVHNEYGRVLQSLTGNRNVRGKGAWKAWLASEVEAGRLKIEYLPVRPVDDFRSEILAFAMMGPDDFNEMAAALTATTYDRQKCEDAIRYMVFNDNLARVQEFLAGDWLSRLFAHQKININDVGYFLNGLANPRPLRKQIDSQVRSCLDSDNPVVVANALNLIAGVKGFSTRFVVPDVEDKVIKLASSSVPEIAVQAQRALERIRPGETGVVSARTGDAESAARGVLQQLIDSTPAGQTVKIPKGVYAEPVTITKPLTLKGESVNDCVIEVTANEPAIFVDAKGKGKVIIEAVTVKWQLATSDRCECPFAVAVKDGNVEVKNCIFQPLGNFKRSPVAINSLGFSELNINTCRFEGFEYTVCFGQGTKGVIRNSLVMDSGHQGISLYDGATAEIIGNVVTGSRYHAVRSTGGTLNMTDNLIINNANRGVYLGNKSALGTIANNVIIGNGTGVDGFARSDVKVENNVIADSSYAGIGMRNSCSLSIRDNIFRGNERGLILFKEGGRNGNNVYKNTFWLNKVDAENLDKAADSIVTDPNFVDADNGDFSLKPGPALQQKQGLTNPEIFKVLWKIWQNRSDKNEPFKGISAILNSEKTNM
jgi:beta-lactamase regulating signal transducer with metallopeptidase domain/nitrous oxidase accessory protein NosD